MPMAPLTTHAAGMPALSDDALKANVLAMIDALTKAKPSGAKGQYVKRVALSSTMGPGFKVDLSTVGA